MRPADVRRRDRARSRRLAAQQPPLLVGGSSFSNIYAGAAADARFCAETLPNDKFRLAARPFRTAIIALLYLPAILRVVALAALECAIALGDIVRGVFERENLLTELKFIASRVGVAIVLREYIRVAAKLAIEEGSPVIYANFLGYDEHAHRRGPGSWFAHWTLKGIDDVIGDISRASRRSPQRCYEVVVFSGHGQERTLSYDRVAGRSIAAAMREVAADGPPGGGATDRVELAESAGQILHQRAQRMLRSGRRRATDARSARAPNANDVIVTALGPLGHIYFPQPLAAAALENYAHRLTTAEHVPLVLFRDASGVVRAHNRAGRWQLPEDASQVLGGDHAFLHEAAADLAALCRHPDAGELVIAGWQLGVQPMTFVRENGSHGSVGPDEVRGFLLAPEDFRLPERRASQGDCYVRGEDLYRAARAYLQEASPPVFTTLAGVNPMPRVAPSFLRLMTYNIHSCIGLDGRVRPTRILQVIRSSGADVIALQEVDSNRRRSNHAHQARFLAERLEMSHHFYAVLDELGEQYGLAVISRWPIVVVQSSHLTSANPRRRREARGALWVEIDSPWGPVQLINTHFGLTRLERRTQASMLVSEDWLGKIRDEDLAVLCGDLNAGPVSAEFRTLTRPLRDVQTCAASHRPLPTFPSPLPVRRLDHILVSRALAVERIVRPRTPTAIVASDHLPLCVDLIPPRHAGSRLDDGARRGDLGASPPSNRSIVSPTGSPPGKSA